ncbi:MAG TPA: anti-sigma factor domain-containing protein [Paenibacillus sp.]|nr:anti-sigma factor domain-containing protein [Paenibacillus sp.]
MNRGVVLEVQERHAIVLTDSGAFVRVPKRGRAIAVGEEIALPAARRGLPRRAMYAWTSAATAAMVFAFLLFSMLPNAGPPVAAQPVAYVSIDINPSVELGLDAESVVVEATGRNEDAERLLEGLELVGQPLERAVGDVMEAAETLVLSERSEADIVITSVVVDEDAGVEEAALQAKAEAEVERVIQAHHADNAEAYRVTVWSAPKEVLEEAAAAGLSVGKMTFLLKAQARGVEVTAEQLRDGSISDVAKQFGDKQLLEPDPQFTKDAIKALLKQAKEQAKEARKSEGGGVEPAEEEMPDSNESDDADDSRESGDSKESDDPKKSDDPKEPDGAKASNGSNAKPEQPKSNGSGSGSSKAEDAKTNGPEDEGAKPEKSGNGGSGSKPNEPPGKDDKADPKKTEADDKKADKQENKDKSKDDNAGGSSKGTSSAPGGADDDRSSSDVVPGGKSGDSNGAGKKKDESGSDDAADEAGEAAERERKKTEGKDRSEAEQASAAPGSTSGAEEEGSAAGAAADKSSNEGDAKKNEEKKEKQK